MKHVHGKGSHRSDRISDGASRTKARLDQVSKALAELYELIENYSPTFYTRRHHDHAAAALRLVGKRP
jgi:acid phosphatase class B